MATTAAALVGSVEQTDPMATGLEMEVMVKDQVVTGLEKVATGLEMEVMVKDQVVTDLGMEAMVKDPDLALVRDRD